MKGRHGVDPITGVLAPYGAVGLLALIALVVARTLFERLHKAQEEERERWRESLRRAEEAADRERARADRLEGQLNDLNGTVRNVYLGAIAQASQAANDATRAVADALAAVRGRG